tara:strand:+ start:624 stop:1136 length:513 start_codon:yes stop_codon:yes gene_type:complete
MDGRGNEAGDPLSDIENILEFKRSIGEARPFEIAARDKAFEISDIADFYDGPAAFERLETVALNVDGSFAVLFLARAPNNDQFIEIMLPDVSGEMSYAGYLGYAFHDDPTSSEGTEYRVEIASMNSHHLISFDNGATRVNFGLSDYGVAGVGQYAILVAQRIGLRGMRGT